MITVLRRGIAGVGFGRARTWSCDQRLNRVHRRNFAMALEEVKGLEEVISKAAERKVSVTLPDGTGLEDVSEMIVLGGWWGGKLNHVLKYRDLVQTLRPNAAIVACVPSQMTGVFKGYKGVAKDVLNVMQDVAGGTNNEVDVTLYYFSNGGMFLHRHLVDFFQNTPSNLQLKSIVMDSCPAYFTPETTAKALNGGKSNKFLLGFFQLMQPFSKLDLVKWWTFLENLDLNVPELYIFSRGDDVTIASKIEELIEVRKEKGVDITECIFEDSGHVVHYKVHPEEYKAALDNFLNA